MNLPSNKGYSLKKFKSALIIGGGAFGTSIACVLSQRFEKVLILVRSKDVFESLLSGENSLYLHGMKLPTNIVPVMTWEDVKKNTYQEIQIIISGLPSHAIRSFHTLHKINVEYYLEKKVPYVCLSKGIDAESLFLPDDMYSEIFPDHTNLFTYLSGPSFAKEIVEKQITLIS